ncbi:PBSX family phage terminase large subunit [Anaerosinus massiliensis]|uniref:PBSX family phage terminase large subunit n=1 Tax=Massilibacillus massiliensis TaxID=1806837 RepID=UPI000AAE2F54|nr:PBSX family phage terminase large subunit [Massilibacillus massiliensis]
MTSKNKLSLQQIVGKGYADYWNFRGRYRVCKGSRASKKSKTTALWYISKMMQYPLANLIVMRRTFRTLKDSCFTELKWAIHRLQVDEFWQVKESPLEITYKPTGQKIYFRGLDDPLKITSITVEYGCLCWAWIEEAYELEDEETFNRLDESIRGEVPEGYFKQFTLTFNPWSASHWLKRRFFDEPNINVLAKTTNYLCNEFLDEADKQVFEDMKKNDPGRYKVAGLGEWGIAEGQFFSMWRDSLHVVQPFKIPEGWMRFRSMDWGSYHPYSVGWYAVDYDGNLWRYRELYGYGGKPNVGTKETAIQVAEKIAAYERDDNISYGVLDNACWARTGTSGPSIAEEINNTLIKHKKIPFMECEKGREQMAEQVKLRLVGHTNTDGVQIPAVRFFSTCYHAIRTIPMLTHDKIHPEKVDTTGEDHPYDELGYACLSRPWTPDTPKKSKSDKTRYKEKERPSAWAV